MKDWLNLENERNRKHTELYTRAARRAFGDIQCMVGHHIEVQDGTTQYPVEIPSADTFLGDHFIMQRIFGARYLAVIRELFGAPVEARDALFEAFLNEQEVTHHALAQVS